MKVNVNDVISAKSIYRWVHNKPIYAKIFQTHTCKQKYPSARHKEPCRGLKKKYLKAEYVQRHVCFVYLQSSLHENVVFSVCARMGNAAYTIFIMWNSISGLDTCYHFRLNISCGVAVTVRSHQKKYQVTF